MKKTIIGSVFMLSGVIITMSIIIAGVIYIPNVTEWSGSKLWYVIFGSEQSVMNGAKSLSLGIPFVTGIVITTIGLVILVNEFFFHEK
jgi:hypothetical protein